MGHTHNEAGMTVFSVAVWSDTPGFPLVLTITAKNTAGALRKVRKWYPGSLTSIPEPCCPYGDPECPAPGTPIWQCRHLECRVGTPYGDETERPLAALTQTSRPREPQAARP
jgi:hypothetical protein